MPASKFNYPEIKKIIIHTTQKAENYMPEYNIMLYCIPETIAAKSILTGDPFIGWRVLWGRKISAAKSETGLESEVDDVGIEGIGGGGLGGGIEAPLDFLDCGFSTNVELDSKIFESE